MASVQQNADLVPSRQAESRIWGGSIPAKELRTGRHQLGTAEGKARTRRNLLKHGLTAETIVHPFESPDDYRELQQAVLDDLQPQGITQQIHVERFVQRA